MDPAWSAFAHYNRASLLYDTNERVADYIRRAMDDLKAALCKLENYKHKCLFTEIHVNRTGNYCDDVYDDHDNEAYKSNLKDDSNTKLTRCYFMVECQLLNHIDTQITECIEKLETIDTMKAEAKTELQNILDLIPGADRETMEVLQEYSQLGLLFTYNMDKKPKFSYRHKILSSLVILESVANILRMAVMRGILVSTDSNEVTDMIDASCDIGSFGDSSLGWIPRSVSKVINVGVHTMFFIRDISSLVPIKSAELESSSGIISEPSQFSQFASVQVASVLN